MFTGIISEMGEITAMQRKGGIVHLSLKAYTVSRDAGPGDSISVNGVCLTVVDKNDKVLSFDLSDETLRSTNLGNLKTGDRVNLEPSLRPDSRLGGHFVTGHVDGVGRIRSKTNRGETIKFEIEAPKAVTDLLVEKGSVAVDGISLTVVDVLLDGFTIVIIPHTARVTTIGFKGPGDTVNLEADIIGKYVAKFLNREKNSESGLMNALMNGGYIRSKK